jgi:diacylglycerol kinase (ATP)
VDPYVIIYNPEAAQGRARERIPEVESLLHEARIHYELQLTEYPGHASVLSRDAARRDVKAVVAAGGDGTTNEVVNGLMSVRHDHRIPPLGVLCVGRGNDFAFGAGMPTTVEDGVVALQHGAVQPIDLGLLKGGRYPEGRYFCTGIGIGFDTIVGFEAAKMKWIKGFASYVVGALKTLLLYYRTPLLTITTDLEREQRASIQMSVMNGRRMGGAFHMAPQAQPDDGFFDLCIAGSPRRFQMLGLIFRYMNGSQESSPHITMGRSRRVRVSSAGEPLAIHADGETISTDHTSIELECIPRPISVIKEVPAAERVVAPEVAPA